MFTLHMITLCCWIIIGLIDINSKEPISKLSYGMMWVVLVMEILMNGIHEV